MRISTTSCLCPFLVCLCFIQRYCGASHHVPTKVPSKNQTRLANGEAEVHHRPKRGWIWNQFFVLEEHMGPDAQYVGKVGFYWADCKCKKKPFDAREQLTRHFSSCLLRNRLEQEQAVLLRYTATSALYALYRLMWKFRSHCEGVGFFLLSLHGLNLSPDNGQEMFYSV